ncbi:MAG TPA: S1 RNA-binding domain-containing protein [Candidatus Nanoarchaeia archaeon]|nr:S1 RNA-binding domain-containing protein [Candidatus Nanoarchaeia archaeon]
MVFRKQGYPETNEVVVCTVKKVLPHSIFCDLDEYTKEGMIHISEVAPGRIRNIRDHVEEGRKVACKILSIDKEKGHINLSLRRVNQSQKIKKFQEFKQEGRASKILQDALKGSSKEETEKIAERIMDKYLSLTSCFNAIVNENLNIADLKIDKKFSDNLIAIVKEKIKPPEVKIKTKLFLESTQPDGITRIKKILDTIKKTDQSVSILYLGAPSYKIEVTSFNYKEAELKLKKVSESTEKLSKQLHCTFKFERQDK